jgi:hypothetical protein
LANGKTAASSEWRLADGETANFLEGSAPALPKILGASGDAPSRNFCRMNSALRKIRHQPLAKASGMDRKILKGSHSAPLCTLALTHAYTPARLHPCTQDRSW